MKNGRILINGAGIAGPTLAYWLKQYGFEPTLVERAPGIRQGGYIVDFWGIGFDVAEKMGLLPNLRSIAVSIDELRFVDERGIRAGGFSASALMHSLGNRYITLHRSDLARCVYGSLEGKVTTIFDDTIIGLAQGKNGVHVDFQHGHSEIYDLVIGAGGLHSRVRYLVFGSEARFEKYMGYYVASFTAEDYAHHDERAYVSYAAPGRQVTRYSLDSGRTAFLFVFSSESKLEIAAQDTKAQKAILHTEFGRAGWECSEILDDLDTCAELYFDSISQSEMDAWSRGRVALVGDACFCPSLLAGQGAALAMAGAYVLAGELQRCRGEYPVAFKNYEDFLRPLILEKQKSARRFAASFVPRTRTGIFVRNKMASLMGVPLVADLFMGKMLKDSVMLPTYH